MIKVVYVLPTLESIGGTERIITQKANYLAEQFGYDVSIICCNQQPNKPNFYFVSTKVRQIYIGIPYYTQYIYKYPKRLWIKIKIFLRLKKELTRAIQHLNPDILIGIGHFNADMVCTIPCKAIRIIECHDAKYFMKPNTGNRTFLTKLYRKIYLKFYYRTIERHADLVVTLTEGAKDLWNKARRVVVIPNFSSMSVSRISDCTSKRVIAVGRLSTEKGFDRLIDIWKTVSEKYTDWHLDIFGNGELKEALLQQIKKDQLDNITLQGVCQAISKEYATSSILAVTSRLEAFSLAILEAMKHGVPCIAFDCPYGPRSIIENNQNGFLVEDGNNALYKEKLCQLIEDIELRHRFSAVSLEKTHFYDTDAIMLKWKTLFEDLIIKRDIIPYNKEQSM